MTKKKWIIFIVLLFVAIYMGKIIGRQVGTDTATQEGIYYGDSLREKIKSSCLKYEGATEQACECHANRVVNEIPAQELNKFGKDRVITEKVASIAMDCILQTKE